VNGYLDAVNLHERISSISGRALDLNDLIARLIVPFATNVKAAITHFVAGRGKDPLQTA